MTHFGFLCFPPTGHLNPMIALARELKKRGNQVTFFQIADTEEKVLAAELECHVMGLSEFPKGWFPQKLWKQGQLKGIASLIEGFQSQLLPLTEVVCRELPRAIEHLGVDIIVVDQFLPGRSVAEYLSISSITVCCCIPFYSEASIPPPNMAWSYKPSWLTNQRNRLASFIFEQITKSIKNKVNEYRRQWKLSSFQSINELSYSKIANLIQLPPEFDFPRQKLPANFYYTGPLIDITSSSVPGHCSKKLVSFPFESLTDQPLIYASLGTVLNNKVDIFQIIAEACANLDYQLVISVGRFDILDSLPKFAGSPLVVGYAPQLELFPRTALVISHGGLNTTMEALSCGVPQVAIPLGTDQPGVAARMSWNGAGELILPNSLAVSKLRATIKRVLSDNSYRENAARLQTAIQKTGGVKRAADIIEQVIKTKH